MPFLEEPEPDIRYSYWREKKFYADLGTTSSHIKTRFGKFLWIGQLFLQNFFLSAQAIAMLIEFYINSPKYSENPVVFIDTLYYFITHIAGWVKFLGIQWKWEKFKDLESIINKPSFYEVGEAHRDGLIAFNKSQRKFGIFFHDLCLTCVLSYAIKPFVEGGNELPLPGTFLIEDNHWGIAYFVQIMGLFYSALTNSAADVMSVCLIRTMVHKFDMLMEDLATLKRKTEEENIYWVKEKIKQHKDILKAVLVVEEIVHTVAFAQFVNSIIVICCTCFQMLLVPVFSGDFLSLLSYLSCMLGQLIIYNWYGYQIILRSSDIGSSIYMSEWYECSAKVRKYLFMMMERAKMPSKLTTGKLITLSLPTLGVVLRSSYSYLLALRQTIEQDDDI